VDYKHKRDFFYKKIKQRKKGGASSREKQGARHPL